MCGIVAIYSRDINVVDMVLDSLEGIEYRGYDSVGFAFVNDNKINLYRAVGNVNKLRNKMATQFDKKTLFAKTVLGHTRWATNGEVNEQNAHPHVTDKVLLIHNGIIDNFYNLKKDLLAKGYSFNSNTDSEVICKLIHHNLSICDDHYQAVSKAIELLEGCYSFVVSFADYPDLTIAVQNGASLVLGYGANNLFYLSSDVMAMNEKVNAISYIDQGEIVVFKDNKVEIFNKNNTVKIKERIDINKIVTDISKKNFDHYFLKEVFEQPKKIDEFIKNFSINNEIYFSNLAQHIVNKKRIIITGCGSSYYAACIAKYWLESINGITTEVILAAELEYSQRAKVDTENSIIIALSQSGETNDVLKAVDHCQENNIFVISVVNNDFSRLCKKTDYSINIKAGKEISVAATKTFVMQLVSLFCLTVFIGKVNNNIDSQQEKYFINKLLLLSNGVIDILNRKELIKDYLYSILDNPKKIKSIFYIGGGAHASIALEGALKMQEISYIPAHGYPASNMKHGPIAVLDEKVPVIALMPPDVLFNKVLNSVNESIARKAPVFVLCNKESLSRIDLNDKNLFNFIMPEIDMYLAPILYSIPMQLLSYYAALKLGNNIDQPRNLAKSVTVD